MRLARIFRPVSTFLFACLMVLGCGLARAQSVDTAGLEVDVKDPSGALVAGATLTLTQTTTHDVRTGVTNSKGVYRFVELPVGSYELTVEHAGFAETHQTGLTLSVGQASTLPVSMAVANGAEIVQVNGDVSQIDPDRTTIGQTISQQEIDDLPSNGRNFLDFAVTVPNVTVTQTTGQNSGFSVNGQRSRSNSIMIDGVENNGALNGNVRQTLSQDAIAQFQVLTEQFPAEFGGAGGGFINVVTKAGSDQFHGSAYYFVRTDFLNTPNIFASATPGNYHRNDMGMSLGGPLKHNRTYFFGALEYIGLNTSRASNSTLRLLDQTLCNGNTVLNPIVTGTSLLGTNAQQMTCHLRNGNPLKGSPLTQVGNTGYIPQSSAQTLSSIRVDHRIGDRDTLVGRVLYVQYIQAQNVDAGSVYDYSTATSTYTHTQNYFTEWTHIFSPTLLNEVHLMVAPQRLRQANKVPGPGGDEGGSVIFGATSDFPVTLDEDHYEGDDAVSKTLGNHLFKAGVQVNYIRAHSVFPSYFAGQWNYSTIANFVADNPYRFQQSFGNPEIRLPDTLLGFYAEDSWKALPRLTLNLGVRYDLDLQPQGFNQNASDPIQNVLSKGMPRDYNNFAPRLGLAYSLDGKGKTVLRAGYGMFYDKNILILARNQLITQEKLVLLATTPTTAATQYKTGPLPQSTSYPTGMGSAPSINRVFPGLVIPMIHQADLGIDRALNSKITLSVTGVHVEGEKLLKAANANLSPPVILTTANQQNYGFSAPILTPTAIAGTNPVQYYYTCSPTVAAPTSSGIPNIGSQPAFQQCNRPYYGTQARTNPNFIDINTVGPWGHSNYNGLRSTLVVQSYHGLTTRLGFVWSRAEDDAPDFLNGALPDNPYNPHAEKSLSNEDVRNRFTGSLVYRMPNFFRKGWKKQVLGNWVFSGTMVQGSGTPENITVGSDENNDDSTADRPFINGVIVGRNTFRGARNSTVTLRGQKEFRLQRGSRLALSAEVFNALGHYNITDYNTIWGTLGVPSSTFGNATAAGDGRVIQLGGKYTF